MKKLLIIALTLTLMFASFTPALAKGGNSNGSHDGGDQIQNQYGEPSQAGEPQPEAPAQNQYGEPSQAGKPAKNQNGEPVRNQNGEPVQNQYGEGSQYRYQYVPGSSNSYGPYNRARHNTDIQGSFNLAGVITSIDPVAKTITVTVACGNYLLKEFLTQEVTIYIGDSTRFVQRNPDGTVTLITFADLVTGLKVSIHGEYVDETFTTSRITLNADLTCLP